MQWRKRKLFPTLVKVNHRYLTQGEHKYHLYDATSSWKNIHSNSPLVTDRNESFYMPLAMTIILVLQTIPVPLNLD